MSGTERSVAGRTSKRLDPFGMAMLAISHQCMDGSVCDAEVRALLIGTSEPFGVDAFGAPRRLFTSGQGRTDTGAGPPADEIVEPSRQAGQPSGERGLRRRWSVLRLAPPREEEGRRWSQSRRQSSTSKRGKKNTSKNKKT